MNDLDISRGWFVKCAQCGRIEVSMLKRAEALRLFEKDWEVWRGGQTLCQVCYRLAQLIGGDDL